VTGKLALTYVELDLDYCANTYGTAPCTAAVPTTGPYKCFNAVKTCQDRAHYVSSLVTLRFGKDLPYNPKTIACIPSIKSVSFTPSVISLGKNLGQRANVTITFTDHPHPDTGSGYDKYLSTRTYNPFLQGTYWSKFRARHFAQGRNLRLIYGFVGQALADMEVHNLVVDTFSGPDFQGNFTLVAKDILKLADDDRSQCPRLSHGTLLANITNAGTSATLDPAGIGNLEYPASGKIAIGGKEIISFTRVGDVLTITRAQNNTVAIAHTAGELMQLCVSYTGVDPANILYDLVTNYTDINPSFITLSDWTSETSTYFGQLLTAIIAVPTGVATLMSEIIEQAGLAMWWDDRAQKIRLQVLKAITAAATTFTANNYRIDGTLKPQEQDSVRLSEVHIFFGQRNPLDPQTNHDNYQAAVFREDLQAATDYGSTMRREIFSRWIPFVGKTIADRTTAIILGRYRDPPRKIAFDLFRVDGLSVQMGGGYNLTAWMMQDQTGAPATVPIQVLQINPQEDKIAVVAEESLFTHYDTADLLHRVITVPTTNDFNLYDAHNSIYPPITAADVIAGVTLRCVVPAGVIVGATSTAKRAFDVDNRWVSGVPITVQLLGRIAGAGGLGGSIQSGGVGVTHPGLPGGVALYTRVAITLDDSASTAELWAGGGGGGGGKTAAFGGSGGGGGGGAGRVPGLGGAGLSGVNNGASGSDTAGGLGTAVAGDPSAYGGNGGGPGLDGTAGGAATVPPTAGSPGGVKGAAIDGVSFVTTVGSPHDRRGTQIN
jgi:hypothetical protein